MADSEYLGHSWEWYHAATEADSRAEVDATAVMSDAFSDVAGHGVVADQTFGQSDAGQSSAGAHSMQWWPYEMQELDEDREGGRRAEMWPQANDASGYAYGAQRAMGEGRTATSAESSTRMLVDMTGMPDHSRLRDASENYHENYANIYERATHREATRASESQQSVHASSIEDSSGPGGTSASDILQVLPPTPLPAGYRYSAAGIREKHCQNCEQWVSLGSDNKTERSFHMHFLAGPCKRQSARNEKQRAASMDTREWEKRRLAEITASLARSRTPPRAVAERSYSAPPSSPLKDTLGSAYTPASPTTRQISRNIGALQSASGRSCGHELGSIGEDIEPDESLTICSRDDPLPRLNFQKSSAQMHRAAPLSPRALLKECPGVLFVWPAGSMYSTYPWQLHDTITPGYYFTKMTRTGCDFWARANGCSVQIFADQTACLPCSQIAQSPKLLDMKRRAELPLPAAHSGYEFYNHPQMKTQVRLLRGQINTQKLEILNLNRRLGTLLDKMDDFKRFVMAVGTMDVPRLHQLVRTALNCNASVDSIVALMEKAIEGTYHVRGYDTDNLDLTRLIQILGGGKLVYALNHAIGTPSMSTSRRNSHRLSIIPCTAAPSDEEIDHNLHSNFSNTGVAFGRPLTGHAFLIDEISLDERPRYHRPNNSIVGLCREHAPVDGGLEIESVESVEKIASMINKGDCHLGKEATVLAVASFSSEDYHARPIIVSPTCKTENSKDQAVWIWRAVERYRLFYADARGMIWCISTDGDGVRRPALHSLLMKYMLDENLSLYQLLCKLAGMNLYVGEFLITMDSDPKHLFKRFCTLIRTRDGIVIGDFVLNSETLTVHLLRIEGMTLPAVRSLINPADHQNVPMAVRLLQSLKAISLLPIDDLNPTQRKAHSAIELLSEMLSALVEPFVDVHLSLEEQLAKVSKYAHIAFVMFRKHGTNFMSNQLYADSQTMVKNLYFCVAKQQELDPMQAFYLSQIGDDRLELCFCECRCNTHHRNHDILELCSTICAVCDAREILNRQPAWDRGHKRLKLSGAEGVDHVNPRSWKGDATAGRAGLLSAWTSGKASAIAALSKYGITCDFEGLFARENLDMLRPFGDGKYPGIAVEKDRSLEEPVVPDVPEAAGADTPAASADKIAADELRQLEEELYDTGAQVELEDLLPDVPPNIAKGMQTPESVPTPPTFNAKDWIWHEGAWIHKSSALRRAIQGMKKSTDRNSRSASRSFSFSGAPLNLNLSDITDPSAIHIGDLAALLVKSGGAVVLAIMTVTALRLNGKRVDQVKRDELRLISAKISVTGQLMCLRPADSSTWVWTGRYMELPSLVIAKPAAPGTESRLTRRSLTLSSPGHLVYPLNPELCATVAGIAPPNTSMAGPSESCIPPEASSDSPAGGMTWSFKEDALESLALLIWANAKNEMGDSPTAATDVLQSMPKCGEGLTLPYRNLNGNAMFVAEQATAAAAEQEISDEDVVCHQCTAVLKRKTVREHVGKHILLAKRGVQEDGLAEKVHDYMPCGFCGRGGCAVTLLKTATTFKAKSACSHHHSFGLKAALKGSDNTPCTNAPIICGLCYQDPKLQEFQAIWKYNMVDHLRTSHPGQSTTAELPSHTICKAALISRQEQTDLGVPDALNVEDFPGTEARMAADGEGVRVKKAKPSTRKRPAVLPASPGPGPSKRSKQ
ncbi:hypothetical protein PLICRDRAFT_701936 [Plicaturopsis crispa FD-325 SS-3]|uniref:Unplaced genomic scaffold PLICRscaffold_18, whole genome shotgun sequence n=1 Tax=Plicaturopsis crispa FD-325 SS-3 TaxID=944288 RepID=A0A0C9SXG5_PLICR|nr:hypothetical protein PLICRDRAFT_701936 [Plicaturopsis crispa FD-325 SS-3]